MFLQNGTIVVFTNSNFDYVDAVGYVATSQQNNN